MRPVSDRFLAALRGSHAAAIEAYVVDAGQTGVEPTGTRIDVIGGNVTLDASADIRAVLDMETPGEGAFPTAADDLLAPFGNEVFVRRGVGFGGGAVEWVSLGYFRIRSAEQDTADTGPIRLMGQDRMGGIIRARLVAPRQFAATDTYGDVMDELVQEVYPWATIEWDDTADTDPLARALICEQDRFGFLDELVTGLGKIWHWDHRGVLVVEDAPDPGDPVWTVDSGANGVLVDMGREVTDEGVYNALVVSGEALDTVDPPSAVAYDNSPDSPTYWEGPFGKVPRFYVSSFITTEAQAQTTANALLRSTLGVPYNVDFRSIVNPALEPWDPVTVRLKNRAETHVVGRLIVPLSVGGAMTAETREQTLIVIGEGDA